MALPVQAVEGEDGPALVRDPGVQLAHDVVEVRLPDSPAAKPVKIEVAVQPVELDLPFRIRGVESRRIQSQGRQVQVGQGVVGVAEDVGTGVDLADQGQGPLDLGGHQFRRQPSEIGVGHAMRLHVLTLRGHGSPLVERAEIVACVDHRREVRRLARQPAGDQEETGAIRGEQGGGLLRAPDVAVVEPEGDEARHGDQAGAKARGCSATGRCWRPGRRRGRGHSRHRW